LIAIALPDTPDGYDWTSYEEAKSAFLKPDNWYVKKEKRKKRKYTSVILN
jgi:hypothetical protein